MAAPRSEWWCSQVDREAGSPRLGRGDASLLQYLRAQALVADTLSRIGPHVIVASRPCVFARLRQRGVDTSLLSRPHVRRPLCFTLELDNGRELSSSHEACLSNHHWQWMSLKQQDQ